MSERNLYITTTLPYVNSDPHVGFALEIVHADIMARYKKLCGFDVFFNTGTDEHGSKVHAKALENGKDPQEYVNEYAEKFKGLKKVLGLSEDINFIRTTDEFHKKSAQAFWKKCADNGYIYKKNYKMKYCVGCELEKTDSELVDGKCPIHPNTELQLIEEENYFFKFSDFQERLLKLYEDRPDFVLSSSRFNEIKSFVSRGLEDFSISRLKSKMPWGVPVPGDDEQVMYVWFDALVNYVSAIGWPDDMEKFNKYWPVVQFAGKDNLRQQSAMWQAMLMAADIEPSKQIVIHGFINSGGQKMSKSLGNVINPYDVVSEYGTDALRYFLAREMNTFEDSDFTMEKFKESYNANLANGIGNLTSRIMKMAETHLESSGLSTPDSFNALLHLQSEEGKEYKEALDSFDIKKASDIIWREIKQTDAFIQSEQPFKLIKMDLEKGKTQIKRFVVYLARIAVMLEPVLPDTAQKIKDAIKANAMPSAPLFARKD
ncbi:MAG: methionine--tRNA ligase [Candidatus Paceibacterota bacterium]